MGLMENFTTKLMPGLEEGQAPTDYRQLKADVWGQIHNFENMGTSSITPEQLEQARKIWANDPDMLQRLSAMTSEMNDRTTKSQAEQAAQEQLTSANAELDLNAPMWKRDLADSLNERGLGESLSIGGLGTRKLNEFDSSIAEAKTGNSLNLNQQLTDLNTEKQRRQFDFSNYALGIEQNIRERRRQSKKGALGGIGGIIGTGLSFL